MIRNPAGDLGPASGFAGEILLSVEFDSILMAYIAGEMVCGLLD